MSSVYPIRACSCHDITEFVYKNNLIKLKIGRRVPLTEISHDGQSLAWASQGLVAWATLRGSKVIAKTIPGPEQWFKKELHALAACIPCPNVVTLEGWSEDPSIHPPRRVLLMEPIVHRGFQKPMNLYERYTNNDFPFTAEKKMACLRDVCKALKFMHELRPCALFYRDLKSMNVCLRDDDSACLVDLGLSMFEKSNAQYAQSHAVEQSVSRPATEGYICPTYKYAILIFHFTFLIKFHRLVFTDHLTNNSY